MKRETASGFEPRPSRHYGWVPISPFVRRAVFWNRLSSLITADLAVGYHRDCFAVPGRASDAASIGCNRLIRDNKAALIQSAEEFVQIMGWAVAEQPARTEGIQRNLFPELTEEEELVVRILMRQGDLHINTMVVEADIPVNRMSALLFELEMKGVVKAMVGGVYHLLT